MSNHFTFLPPLPNLCHIPHKMLLVPLQIRPFILNAQYNIHEYRNYIDFYLELSILLLIPSWIVLEFTLLRFSITSTSTVFWKLGCFFLEFLSVSDKSLLPMSIQHKVASLHPRENSHTYKTSQCFHKRLNILNNSLSLSLYGFMNI